MRFKVMYNLFWKIQSVVNFKLKFKGIAALLGSVRAFWKVVVYFMQRALLQQKLPSLLLDIFMYSRGTSLTYGYLINPMKMKSLWEDKNHPKNAASLLILNVLLMLKIWGW